MTSPKSSDAGPEDAGVLPVFDRCENCGQPAPELVYIPGFDHMGCAECAVEAIAVGMAEDSTWHCDSRAVAVQKAKTICGVVVLLSRHNLECPQCGGIRKPAGLALGAARVALALEAFVRLELAAADSVVVA